MWVNITFHDLNLLAYMVKGLWSIMIGLNEGVTSSSIAWGYLYLQLIHMRFLSRFNFWRNPFESKKEPLSNEGLESW